MKPLIVTHTITAAVGVAFLFYAYASRIEHAIFAAIALIAVTLPFALFRRFDLYVPPVVRAGYAAFIAGTLLLGGVERFYDRFPWWDSMIHSYAGFGLALIAHIAISIVDGGNLKRSAPWMLAIASVALSITVSVGWEIFEFAVDDYLPSEMQPHNEDTMWDLIGATIAALCAGYLGWRTETQRGTDDAISDTLKDGVRKNNHHAP